MKNVISLFIFLQFFHFTFGQNVSEKVINMANKKTYSVIPEIIFEDTTIIGIISPIIIGHSKELKISWHSVCTDGTFIITITPEQIYFRSSHDNPNLLYWLIPINMSTYNEINKGFAKLQLKQSVLDKHYVDEKLIPNEWTDSTIIQFEKNCLISTENQIVKSFLLLNSFISTEENKLSENKRILLSRTIYIGNDKEEIINKIPIAIEK